MSSIPTFFKYHIKLYGETKKKQSEGKIRIKIQFSAYHYPFVNIGVLHKRKDTLVLLFFFNDRVLCHTLNRNAITIQS